MGRLLFLWSAGRVAPGVWNGQPRFGGRLSGGYWVWASFPRSRGDRYAKQFSSWDLLVTLIYGQLHQVKSLQERGNEKSPARGRARG
ncbi:hypothetical protein D3C78_1540910 [compost metagenome]